MNNRLIHNPTIKARVSGLLPALKSELKALLLDERQYFAARSLIIYSMQDTLSWLIEDAVEKLEFEKYWLLAAEQLQKDLRLSLDQRLWSMYPRIQFEKSRSAISEAFQQQVFEHVRAIDQAAESEFDVRLQLSLERLIFLAMVDLQEKAEDLLTNEIAQTNTPLVLLLGFSTSLREAKDYEKALDNGES